MACEFELKAQRCEEMLETVTEAPAGAVSEDWSGEASAVPNWLTAYRRSVTSISNEEPPVSPSQPDSLSPMVVLMVMKADATSNNATWGEAFIDRTVQFGQPYPAATHVELWVGDQPGDKLEDNHFSTYLGASDGASWTSGMSDSKQFYSSSAWSAVPIFSAGAERRMRAECNLHCGTPYPSAALLWQYPWSIWPLRAFSGFVDDRISTPAHCAALSARILRAALPEIALPRPSHWYGPSSLYLELSSPDRMERALAVQRPVVRSQPEEEHDEELADALTLNSDDDVAAMSAMDARQAVHALAVQVLRTGSRPHGHHTIPDQDAFRAAQERLARGVTRYTWINRKLNGR